jgi:hypothetical protein
MRNKQTAYNSNEFPIFKWQSDEFHLIALLANSNTYLPETKYHRKHEAVMTHLYK